MSDPCPKCGGEVVQPRKGPKKVYCSEPCKQSVCRKRKRDAARAARPPKERREPAPLRSAERPTRPRFEAPEGPVSTSPEGPVSTSTEGPVSTSTEGNETPSAFEIPAFDALGDDEIDLDAATMAELEGQCRARGLDSTGDREDLITRILAFEAESEYPGEGDNDLDYADPDLESDPADDGLLDAYLATLPDAPPEPSPTFNATRRKWMPDPTSAPARPVQRPAPSKRRQPIRFAW